MNPNNQYPALNQQPSAPAMPNLPPSNDKMPDYNSSGQPSKKIKPPIGFIIALVISILLLILTAVMAIIFYSQMNDYKFNSDKKSATAVEIAKAEQKEELKSQFAEKEKEPLKSYTSPTASASVFVAYPKTWSGYVSEQSTGNLLDGYFNPDIVYSPNNYGGNTANYALRVQMLANLYSGVMSEYNSKVNQGKIKAVPYKNENVPNSSVGVKLDGEIIQGKNGIMVIIPIRDKTLKIWTEGTTNINDFNNIVLKNLKFSP